jgi:hypothetical protein
MNNNNFKHQHSLVLQLLYEASKSNLINENEKKQMKGNT